jgi:hypothetical protein
MVVANPELESSVSSVFRFKLDHNTIYQIDLKSIVALDGSVLDSYSAFFTSRYTPMYTTYNLIA